MKQILLLLYILCVVPVSSQAEESSLPGKQEPVLVKVWQAAPEEIPSAIELVGTIQAVNRAAIAAKVSGTIVEIPVVLGSQVTKGDTLVRISAEEISAKLLQAQAQLNQARRNLAREEKLLKKHASTPETVKSLQDMVRVAEAGYREAKTMLDYTTITAPFSGVITAKTAHVGDLATPGIPLLFLEDPGRLQVVTAVPASLLVRLHREDEVRVQVPAADLEVKGRVAEVAPTADPASRTGAVKIDIPVSDRLRSGLFARVGFPGETTTSLFVPAPAVSRFGQMERVFVLADGKARLRLVRSGLRLRDQVEILAGIEPGEGVILAPVHLTDGQPVRVQP